MPLDTLENTLAHELSDLHSAEQQFAKALAQVARSANSATVKQLAELHREETLQQIENLKQAFALLGKKPERGLVCKGAQGIVEENTSTLKEEKPKGSIKDVALISGSLRIEHYEIAGYSAAISLAKSLGKRDVVKLLQVNLKQEQAAAKNLDAAGSEILKAASAPAPAAVPVAEPKRRGRKPGSGKAAAAPVAEPKRRGRKPGSGKAAATAVAAPAPATKGKRGRPKGSTNRATAAAAAATPAPVAEPKRRGRPKLVKPEPTPVAAPKRRGRKPGSGKKA